MTCCLNESWALAYFQVAVSILLFGVGIPSLALQTIVSEDLRRIVHRHWGFLKWGFLLILVFMLIALAFIWIIHPCETKQTSLLTTLGLNINQWLNTLGLYIGQGIAGGIMTLAIVGVGLVWLLYALHRRDRILYLLKRKCERHIRNEGMPDEEILEDIQYLGQQGKNSGEKKQALKILGLLALDVQYHKRYMGNELDDIIKAIEFTLQKGTDVNSFTYGIQTLIYIIGNIKKTKLKSPADIGSILRTLQRLGDIAFEMDNERSARKVLDAIELISRGPNGAFSEAALTLLVLGVAAIEHKYLLVAVEILNKLEAMTWPKQPLDARTSAAYIGLIAYFWAQKGSAQQKALASIEGVDFSPSLQTCLEGARKVHFDAARFHIADKLADMISGLYRKPRKTG